MLYHGTDIDGPSFDPDGLNVRGRDLNELILHSTYVDALFHIMAGRMPSAEERRRLETFLLRAPSLVPPDHPMLEVTRLAARSGVSASMAMSAGLMVGSADILGRLRADIRLPELGPQAEEALFTFSLPPLLLSAALFPDLADPAAIFRRDGDYLGAVYAAATQRELGGRSEEHTSELQSHVNLVCRLLLE